MKKSELRKLIKEELLKLKEGWKNSYGPFNYANAKKAEDILNLKLNIYPDREVSKYTKGIYFNLDSSNSKKLENSPEYEKIKKLMIV